MARFSGTNKIDLWLKNHCSPEQKEEFILYCRRHYHHKPAILAWLVERGCDVRSISTVYSWMSRNILPGDFAREVNDDAEQYSGLEVIPVMEKCLAQLSRITQKFVEIVEDEVEIPVEEAIQMLPSYARELRSMAQQIVLLKNRADTETLVLSGAARMMEIVMNATGVKDTAEESFFQKTLEMALLQVKEEVSQKQSINA